MDGVEGDLDGCDGDEREQRQEDRLCVIPAPPRATRKARVSPATRRAECTIRERRSHLRMSPSMTMPSKPVHPPAYTACAEEDVPDRSDLLADLTPPLREGLFRRLLG